MTFAVEWLSLPKAGEVENGDIAVVRHDGDRMLIAVIDALGHGPNAARAATAGAEHLANIPFPSDIRPVIDGLHACLRGSRGAAALVCIVSEGRLDGCGVGNVEMRCSRPGLPVVLTAGVLGSNLTRPRFFGGALESKDRVVIFSDGVSSRFSISDTSDLSTKDACQAIFERCRRAHDDATVLVADLGSSS